MSAVDDPTERLFSYGTLQLESVQMATVGRKLSGNPDRLPRFALSPLPIDDASVVAISGKSEHTMAGYTGRDADSVSGTLYAVTRAELERMDDYEVPAVKRIEVTLESGTHAWAYVDARSTGPSDD